MFTRTESFREYATSHRAVTVLILIMMIVFVLVLFPIFPGNVLFYYGTGVNLYIADGQWWRLITPIFLHSTFSHLLFNGFSLAIFGPSLENFLGSFKFTIFFLSTGILANIATFLVKPLTYSHVGSSGAIFGLLGFFLYLVLFNKSNFSNNEKNTVYTLTGIAIIMTFIQPQINVVGHLSGLVTGVLTAPLYWRKKW
ncbi:MULTISPECIES: rhomboid family intramembrane serine protease [unclassified Peribacillus]|uniref:rhomboid family intramembrane serine protease n=1 Tax=unclassified Peribacillus TaxID=2675266 RepID=UPI0019112BC8|nr:MULTISPECIES: rhomboid family intramembrane serine protease [unclassified Peribacillus]MBK5444519.1 rhomboid family intramembrane serine protease [Peribacillus sp. TH24]MBK5460776.1 rhomboid family intramembrane serine protease [Peribacillus sp. TH27]MBK5485909.1 rhomboid family intramembrane serine protease [Peribacillus sp. TH16]MBK5498920.1 rhomboid family intramembrane serine protease [Peribacillus sp. TH14]WMX55975.1 rhomboid family intramembrane serine protease [Peribacillus sp. R9-11